MKKPGILLGALVGGLLTLPLLALLYIGQQIAGFPFVPFNVFNNVRDPKARQSLLVDFAPIPSSQTGELVAKFDIVLG